MAEFEASGLNRSEFCREKGLGLSTLARYRKRRERQGPVGSNRLLAVEVSGRTEGAVAARCSALAVVFRGCRDDRDILQHFLRPAAEKLGLYYPGFGFHSFRREAVTALANEIGVPQTMKAAGHSKADMTLLYTLDDFEKQSAGIRHFQQQVLGSADDPTNPFFISKGTERAKKKSDGEEIVTLCVLNLNGGPVQTRTADLYRVKVAL